VKLLIFGGAFFILHGERGGMAKEGLWMVVIVSRHPRLLFERHKITLKHDIEMSYFCGCWKIIGFGMKRATMVGFIILFFFCNSEYSTLNQSKNYPRVNFLLLTPEHKRKPPKKALLIGDLTKQYSERGMSYSESIRSDNNSRR
jgi:hypothetical protein